jgi:hypothetical protein
VIGGAPWGEPLRIREGDGLSWGWNHRWTRKGWRGLEHPERLNLVITPGQSLESSKMTAVKVKASRVSGWPSLA